MFFIFFEIENTVRENRIMSDISHPFICTVYLAFQVPFTSFNCFFSKESHKDIFAFFQRKKVYSNCSKFLQNLFLHSISF